ncbi:MAG: DUF362 domain-containing protein [Candidatus Latescibacteria bacterium]|nr:DUF362 domain-containing protein [Candidatus Latescibacterota bacterium]NIM22275.1 DUF362 domain-containing protein [Candidatus Latescibacterota bacterium]NIM65754.1 DUF362 domain-containing protein [Candidatus Latescibacterota bacterium]NIO02139.1 DUF362 domain-containing protein [Candidatus Latescibacterota bacterium]NIO28971.1 DUF362 domain-containing protein [Candidatus Latescibacterota bacterium]
MFNKRPRDSAYQRASLYSPQAMDPALAAPIVSVSQCRSYDHEMVQVAVRSVLEPLGGMREFVKRGDTVLLKVNMLAAKSPEKAITTHPVFLKAVAHEVASAGGKIIVGDSPAGAIKGVERYWENTGIGRATAAFGGELVKFEGAGTSPIGINGRVYHLTSILDQVDCIINLPKLKTHNLTLFTGALKNCFGLLPGLQKANFHKAAPKVDRFSEILVDIFSLVKPRLHIMDAIVGLEGNGPSASGSAREIGLVLASPDAVAMDSIASRIIGFEESAIATTRIAMERGLGEGRIERVRLEGLPLSEICIPDYALPSNSLLRFVPMRLAEFVGRFYWVHPKAVAAQCDGCGICIEGCPVDCMSPDKSGVPVIDYNSCINCLGCDESCPNGAIIQEMSWLAKKLQ